jgi:DHA1 family tetracycline resistance protein-like MFS transporter
VAVQGPVLRAASRRYRDSTLILAGGISLAANFALLTSHDTRAVYAAAAFFALGNGLMWPSFLAMLSKVAGDRYQGAVQGFGSSAGSLAGIIGLIMGGILYERIGSMTFAISAAVIVAVCFLSLRLVRMDRATPTAGDTGPVSS